RILKGNVNLFVGATASRTIADVGKFGAFGHEREIVDGLARGVSIGRICGLQTSKTADNDHHGHNDEYRVDHPCACHWDVSARHRPPYFWQFPAILEICPGLGYTGAPCRLKKNKLLCPRSRLQPD